MNALKPLMGVRKVRHAQIVGAVRRAERGEVSDAITLSQAAILNAIKTAIAQHGMPPTVRELADATGLGSSTVAYHLGELQAKRHLHREPGKARGLILHEAKASVTEPPADRCSHCMGTGLKPAGDQS
jgi:hypothetical protein